MRQRASMADSLPIQDLRLVGHSGPQVWEQTLSVMRGLAATLQEITSSDRFSIWQRELRD